VAGHLPGLGLRHRASMDTMFGIGPRPCELADLSLVTETVKHAAVKYIRDGMYRSR
jgi:hypothetical protein